MSRNGRLGEDGKSESLQEGHYQRLCEGGV
jgi:hypothetical protein